MSGRKKEDDINKDKALRIIDALSGVDAELVERSGRAAKPNPAIVTIFTRYLAACAVFIFVCVGAFGIYVSTWRAGSAAPDSREEITGDSSYPDNGAGEKQEAGAQNIETQEDGNITEESAREHVEAIEDLTDNSAKESLDMIIGDTTKQEAASGAEEPEEPTIVEEHIPGIVPERFSLESRTERSDDSKLYHDILLKWTDDDEYISVYITDYYLVSDGIYNLPTYMDYKNITKEAVEENCTVDGGRTSFEMNIKFDDGVWAEVTADAYMTSEEIYKMLVSMGIIVIN